MSFFNELKRRNVFRVGIAYLIVAWLVMQVADVVINNIEAPGWLFQVIMLVLGIGFPMLLIFAWAFEMTPEGIKKEKDVDRSQSITNQTGRKLDRTIIGIMAIALIYFVWESRFQDDNTAATGDAISAHDLAADATSRTVTAAAVSRTAQDNSIAVLPFANRSNVEDDLFFTDGIHDDLLTQLAKIKDLKVISRTSVMEYRDTTKKIPEIAAELGVSTILEGGIQRAGKRIRINAQLINVATDQHLWAETFDREMTVENIFDIQSEITRRIVAAVRGELSDEESSALDQLPTKSLEAYEAYLHAKTEVNRADYTQDKFIAAEAWLTRAVELDPDFALAWAMLVGTNAQGIWSGRDDSPERLQAVRKALEKATRLGPGLPETLAARAEYLYRIENDYHAAEEVFQSASQAQPGDADLLTRLALAQRRTGKYEESISNLQLAIELNPVSVWPRTLLIETLLNMREYERAEPLIDLWMVKYPEAMDIQGFKVGTLIYHYGDLAAARKLLDQLEPWPGNPYYDHTTELPFLEREYQRALDVWNLPGLVPFTENESYKPSIWLNTARAHLFAGNLETATEHAHLAMESASSLAANNDLNNAFKLQTLAWASALSGQTEKALEYSGQARDLQPESRDSLNGAAISMTHALVLGMAGHREESLAEIERLLRTPGGFSRWQLYLSPDFDFFRDDKRFKELARPLNLEESGQ